MVKCDPRHGKYMACCMMYRGHSASDSRLACVDLEGSPGWSKIVMCGKWMFLFVWSTWKLTRIILNACVRSWTFTWAYMFLLKLAVSLCPLRIKLRRRGAQGCECGCGHHQDKAYHGPFEDGGATSPYPRVTSWIYFAVDQGQALPNSDACLFCQHIELFYRDTRETLWFFIGVYSDEVDMLWPNTGDINWYSSPFIAIHFVSWGNKMMWTKVLWRSLSSKLSRTRRQPLKFAVGCSLLLLLRRRPPPPPPRPRPRPRPRRRPRRRRLLLRLLLLTN